MQKFDLVDEFLEFYKTFMPKTVYLMKNKERYDEAVKAICEIAACVVEVDSGAKVKIAPDPLLGSDLCLEITASLIVVDLIDKFCSALNKADNLEVYPRTDGLLGFNVSFREAFIPAPPKGSQKEVKK